MATNDNNAVLLMTLPSHRLSEFTYDAVHIWGSEMFTNENLSLDSYDTFQKRLDYIKPMSEIIMRSQHNGLIARFKLPNDVSLYDLINGYCCSAFYINNVDAYSFFSNNIYQFSNVAEQQPKNFGFFFNDHSEKIRIGNSLNGINNPFGIGLDKNRKTIFRDSYMIFGIPAVQKE